MVAGPVAVPDSVRVPVGAAAATNTVVVTPTTLPDDVARTVDVLRERPAQPAVWVDVALLHHVSGRTRSAATILESALQQPDAAPGTDGDAVRYTLATLYVTLAARARTADTRRDYVVRAQRCCDGHDRPDVLGWLALISGELDAAQAHFERGLASKVSANGGSAALAAAIGMAATLLHQAGRHSGERSGADAARRALKLYRRAIRVHGGDAPAEFWLGLGYAYAAVGRPERAADVFQHVLLRSASDTPDASPPPLDALLALAVHYHNECGGESGHTGSVADNDRGRDKHRALRDILLREAYVATADGASDRRVLNLIVDAYATQFPDGGEAFLDRESVTGNVPAAQAHALYLRARMQHMRGSLFEAERYYGDALNVGGAAMTPARLALSRILLSRGETAAARDLLEQVLAARPASAVHLSSSSSSSSTTTPSAVAAAAAATTAAAADEIKTTLGVALSADLPRQKRERHALAQSSSGSRRQLEQAETELMRTRQRAIDVLQTVGDAHAEATMVLGQLLDRDEPDAALRAYERALRNDTRSVPLNNNVAALYARLGRLDGAHDAIQRCLRVIADSAAGGGDASASDGNGDAAAATAVHIEAVLPRAEHVTVSYNYARLLEMRAMSSEAEALYRRLHLHFPKYTDVTLRLGALARTRGDFDDTERLYQLAVPDPQAVVALAFLYLETPGRSDQAKQMFEYFGGRSGDAYADVMLASFYLTSGRVNRDARRKEKLLGAAASLLQRVLVDSPGNVAAVMLLGTYFAERGMFIEAHDAFTAVVQLGAAASADAAVVSCARHNLASLHVLRGEHASFIAAIRLLEDGADTVAPLSSQQAPTASDESEQDALILRAAAYFGAEQYDACALALERLLHWRPSAAAVWYNLALALECSAERRARDARDAADVDELERALSDTERAAQLFASLAGAVHARQQQQQQQRSGGDETHSGNGDQQQSQHRHHQHVAGEREMAGPARRLFSTSTARAHAEYCGGACDVIRHALTQARRASEHKRTEMERRRAQHEAMQRKREAEARDRRVREQSERAELARMAAEQQRELERRQQEWERTSRGNKRRRRQEQEQAMRNAADDDSDDGGGDDNADNGAPAPGGTDRRRAGDRTSNGSARSATEQSAKKQKKGYAEEKWLEEHGLDAATDAQYEREVTDDEGNEEAEEEGEAGGDNAPSAVAVGGRASPRGSDRDESAPPLSDAALEDDAENADDANSGTAARRRRTVAIDDDDNGDEGDDEDDNDDGGGGSGGGSGE